MPETAVKQQPGATGESLKFESAAFDPGAIPSSCTRCSQPLAGSYWAANEQAVCESCRYALEKSRAEGGGLGTFVRAGFLGALGGLGGATVYFAVSALTGYEFSLLAILVGWLVGSGVRAGSRARGGFAYQALAVVLTYGAIVSTYVPTIVSEMRAHVAEAEKAAKAPAADPSETAPEAAAEAAVPAAADEPATNADMALAIAVLFAFACALPFLGGAGNAMGLIIIAIGLHQAWSMNRREPLELTGPHALARG